MTYVVLGLVLGSLWAITASGIVLTYSTTGVLNLGFGAIAYALAEAFFILRKQHDMGGVPAALVVLFVIAPALAFVLWGLIFRKLEGKGILATMVSTIGLAVALPAAVRFFFPHGVVFVAPGIVENGTTLYRWGNLSITLNQIVALSGAAVVALGLGALLRFTRLGLMMRAVVDRPNVAQLTGVHTNWVSAASWIIACQLAALVGILLAPLLQLQAQVFTELTVASLSVALLASLVSLPIAYVSAIGLGLLSGWLTQFSTGASILSTGLRPALIFFAVVFVLLVRRFPLPVVAERTASFPAPSTLSVLQRRIIGSVVIIVALLIPLLLSNYWRGVVALGLIYALIFLSFTVVLGRAGMLPLGQSAICGLGAFATGYMSTKMDIPLLWAILLGAVFAALCAGVVAVVGVKLGVLEFGLLTLGFGLFCDNVIFRVGSFVPRSGYTFAPTSFFGIDIGTNTSMVYFGAAVFAIAAALVTMVKRRTAGLNMEAMELNPVAAEASGIPIRRYRVAAFMLGALFAGFGAGMLGLYQRHVGQEDFVTFVGLVWLAVLVTLGRRTAIAALIAGLVYSIFPAILSNTLPIRYGEIPAIAFGLGGLSLATDPRGVVAAYRDGLRAIAGKFRRQAPSEEVQVRHAA